MTTEQAQLAEGRATSTTLQVATHIPQILLSAYLDGLHNPSESTYMKTVFIFNFIVFIF
jgi:hypothetical protein